MTATESLFQAPAVTAASGAGIRAAANIQVVEMSVPPAKLTGLAYARSETWVGDPAVLNFGDRLTDGVAIARGERRFFEGDDLARTDVTRVLD